MFEHPAVPSSSCTLPPGLNVSTHAGPRCPGEHSGKRVAEMGMVSDSYLAMQLFAMLDEMNTHWLVTIRSGDHHLRCAGLISQTLATCAHPAGLASGGVPQRCAGCSMPPSAARARRGGRQRTPPAASPLCHELQCVPPPPQHTPSYLCPSGPPRGPPLSRCERQHLAWGLVSTSRSRGRVRGEGLLRGCTGPLKINLGVCDVC